MHDGDGDETEEHFPLFTCKWFLGLCFKKLHQFITKELANILERSRTKSQGLKIPK